jgi:hypothetical protein
MLYAASSTFKSCITHTARILHDVRCMERAVTGHQDGAHLALSASSAIVGAASSASWI